MTRRFGAVVAALRSQSFSYRALLAGSVFAALSATAPASLAAGSFAPLVQTKDGAVQGFAKDSLYEFLGIPYAAPPVGALRWQPPQPPAAWTQPLQATKFGNVCPQLPNLDGFNLGTSYTEDCLYLNVYTPQQASRTKLPVIVWIYGGGLFAGESNDYNARKLVIQGNTVVVTFNYRLGHLGFFAQPAIDAEHHLTQNYGLMDQQFALQWVRQNISRFGGDPFNVTIFGKSAGGQSVFANLASPLANGLFQQGIVESGSYGFQTTSRENAETNGVALANAVGCTDQTAACLRSVSVEAITNATTPQLGLSVDGKVLPLSLNTAFISGRFNRVPIIDGNNHDELRLFEALSCDIDTGSPATPAEYVASVDNSYGGAASEVLARYPLSNYADADEALAAVGTDAGWICTARAADRWLSRYTPVYAYEFNDENAPSYLPPVSFPYGAAHTSELQFLFPGWHGGYGGQSSADAGRADTVQQDGQLLDGLCGNGVAELRRRAVLAAIFDRERRVPVAGAATSADRVRFLPGA